MGVSLFLKQERSTLPKAVGIKSGKLPDFESPQGSIKNEDEYKFILEMDINGQKAMIVFAL
jgi:hypothetical protein